MMAPLGGGNAATLLSANGAQPFGIAVDAMSVYWAEFGGRVMKLPKP